MTNSSQVIIYGSGGHAKVVLDSAVSSNLSIAGFIDDDPAKAGSLINGYKVLGSFDPVIGKSKLWVIAVGNNKQRSDIQARLTAIGLKFAAIVDSSAIISPSAVVGQGCQLLPGTVINANASIGDGVIVNTGAIIEHDCVIEEFSHIAPGSVLLGNCIVGRQTVVGAASVVKPGIKIGNNVIIGAGSVVTKDVEDGSVVTGIPARPARRKF